MCRSISLYVETFPGGIGNLLVLGAMIVSIASGWARLESGLADHDRRIRGVRAAGDRGYSDRAVGHLRSGAGNGKPALQDVFDARPRL